LPPPEEEDAFDEFEPPETGGGETVKPEPDWAAMREKVIAGASEEAEELRREANGYLEQALRDIAQQDQTARTKRESLTAEAWEQAKAKGRAEGLESARSDTLDVIERANKDAEALSAAIQAQGEALRQEAPPLLVRLALDMAEKILRKTLSDDDGAFLSMAAAAIDQAGLVRKVELRLNPADYERVFGGLMGGETGQADFDTSRGKVAAVLSPDPSVSPLGVRAEYPGGSIETGVDIGMEKLREALYGD